MKLKFLSQWNKGKQTFFAGQANKGPVHINSDNLLKTVKLQNPG